MADRTIKVILRAEVNKFRADMATAGQSAMEAARKTETAWDKSNSKLGGLAKSVSQYESQMTTAGTSMMAFGGAVVAGLGLATKQAMSWESAWAGVMKTVDGTPAQMARVESGLRGLARTLPATHEQIAQVAEAAGQLGIHTDNVVAFTKTMIDMGESTNLSAEQAATQLSRFMNIVGTSQKNVGRLGAAIVGLGNNFATTESEIVDMSMRIAGAGKQAGMSEGDILGFATALSSVGIEAEAGGTSISTVMKKMGNEVAKGGDKLTEYARIAGMSSDQFRKSWGDDSAGTMAKFITGLGRAQEAGENVNQTLAGLGVVGIRESDALLRLSSASDVLTESLKMGNSEYEKGTALAEEAAKRYETSEAKIRMAGNALKDNAITIGGAVLPVLAKASQAVVGFSETLSKVPAPVLQVGGVIAGVAGSATLAGGALLVLVPKIVETVTAFKALNVAMSNSDGILGKLPGGLGKVAQGAGLVAIALTAVSASAKLADNGLGKFEDQGELNSELAKLAYNGELTASALDEIFSVSGSSMRAVSAFGDAMKAVDAPGFTKGLEKTIGFFGVFDTKASLAEESLEKFDQALSGAATSGDFQTLQEGFKAAAESAKSYGYEAGDVLEKMPNLKAQLIEQARAMGVATDNATLAKIAMGELKPKMDETGTAIDGVASAADEASQGLRDMLDSLFALGLATLSERDALRGYQEAIDNLTESVSKNGTTLDITTEAGRRNQAALDAIADKGFRAAEAMADNGASQEQLQAHLQSTHDELVKAAGQFGITGDKANDLANEVMGIPEGVDIKTWMSDTARTEAGKTKDAVDKIPRNVTIRIKTVTDSVVTNMPESMLNPDRKKTPVRVPGVTRHPLPGEAGHGVYRRARGSIDYMSRGGVMDPIAQMVPPNSWRVVGDRSDVPEAFIPLDGSARSISLLMETIRRMPGLGMARGGIVDAQKRVDRAQDALTHARRVKASAKTRSARSDAERRVRIAQDELAAAKRALKATKDRVKADEKSAKLAEERRKAEQERAERVRDLRGEAVRDIRRGSIIDQATGGLSGAYSMVDRLAGLGQNKDLSGRARATATATASRSETRLRNLYNQADKLDTKLKNAQEKLQDLESTRNSVKSGLMSGRGIDLAGYDYMQDGKWVSDKGVGGAAKRLSSKVGQLRTFADRLKKLAKAGVPGSLLQEIASAGVADGIALADQFLSASKTDREAYTRAWNDYEKYAGYVGTAVTGGFYKGGVNSAKGLVKGLESEKKTVEDAIKRIATGMQDALKQALGIHSPSRVMRDLAVAVPQGAALGIMDGENLVAGASARMAGAMIPTLPESPTPMGNVSPPASSGGGEADAPGADFTSVGDQAEAWANAMRLMQDSTTLAHNAMLISTQAFMAGMNQSHTDGLTKISELVATQYALMSQTITAAHALQANDTRTAYQGMQAIVSTALATMSKTLTDQYTLMRSTQAVKLGEMRGDAHTGFNAIEHSGRSAFEGIRSGMNHEMGGARTDAGGKLNQIISIFGRFTDSVNAAFKDVGVNLSKPSPLKFATGGLMPGYTPGRDVHKFYSPTGGLLELSGGEPVLRPEAGVVLGRDWVDGINSAARSGGTLGVQRFLDLPHEKFASGGHVPRNTQGLIQLGRVLQSIGVRVSEGPGPFGPVHRVHAPNSWHYRQGALDLNTAPGQSAKEMADFDRIAPILHALGWGVIWRYTGHYGHAHVDLGNRSLGSFNRNVTPGGDLWARLQGMQVGAPVGGGGGMPLIPPFLEKAGIKGFPANMQEAYGKAATTHIAKIKKSLEGDINGLGGVYTALARGVIDMAGKGLINKAKDFAKTAVAPVGASTDMESWRPLVKQALAITGIGGGTDDENRWLKQIKTESHGNPRLVQSSALRDINVLRGDPARGLVQVPGVTWADFGRDMGPFIPNVYDPLKNLIVGMRAASTQHRRKNYHGMSGWRSVVGWGHGYANGARYATQGMRMVGERGPELLEFRGGERVYDSNATQRIVEASKIVTANPASGPVNVNVKVTSEDVAKAMNGLQVALTVDGQQMTGYINSTVQKGIGSSVSRLGRDSYYRR